jgi:hypothetical protein
MWRYCCSSVKRSHFRHIINTVIISEIEKYEVGQWRTQEFCSGGVQQIELRTDDRENGDLGAAAP